MDDKKAMEEYAKEGVELPEMEVPASPEAPAAPIPTPKEEPKVEVPEEKPTEEDEEDTHEENPEPSQLPKRSIYHDLKDKKRELKSERELREQAERERDEALEKLKEKDKSTPQGEDELSEFAKKINADPETLRQMRELFLKGVEQQSVSPEIMQSVNEFKNWQKQNSAAIEEQSFNREFDQSVPTIEREFENVDSEEMKILRKEIHRLAHSKEYHDKEIDYIIFKNRDELSKLVSPKKAGLEPKRKPMAPSKSEFNFDPNADISKLSAADADAWEKEYNRLSKSSELATDSEGRKIFI